MYFLYDLALHLDSYLFQVLALTAIIGAVITGVYWFDVRPQLKAIINGDYSY